MFQWIHIRQSHVTIDAALKVKNSVASFQSLRKENIVADFIQQNFILLLRHHKNAAKILQEHLRVQRENNRQSSYVVRPAKNGQPNLADGSGGEVAFLHSTENPMAKTVQDLHNAMRNDPKLVILFSAGLGYALQALRDWLPHNKLVLIEPDCDMFFEALRVSDLRSILPAPNLHIFLGESAIEDAGNLIDKHPSLFQFYTSLVSGRTLRAKEAADYQKIKERLDSSRQPKHCDEPFAILSGDAHESLLEPLQQESEAAGFKARAIHRPAYINRLFHNHTIWQETLGESLPQQIMSFAKHVLRDDEWKAIHDAGIQNCLWCYDDPFRGKVDETYFQHVNKIFCYDPYITSKLKTVSPIPVEYLPAATAYDQDTPKGMNTYSNESWEITFVGSTGLQRHDDVLTQWVSQKHPVYQRVNAFVESYVRSGKSVPYDDLLAMTIEDVKLSPQQTTVYLQDLATFLVRRYFLAGLQNMPLTIFGDRGWQEPSWVGSLTQHYAGTSLKYAEETPAIYAHSKINLNLFNIQCVNSPTIRMFDVMACGGFLLTEYRPFMDDFFETGTHLDVFRTTKELTEKVNHYLHHEDERKRIAQKGQEFILANHRYRHRIPCIFRQ